MYMKIIKTRFELFYIGHLLDFDFAVFTLKTLKNTKNKF
jgi:hypothetical protein